MPGLIKSMARKAIILFGREPIDVLLTHFVVKVPSKCFCLYHRLGLLSVLVREASRSNS